MAAALTLGLRGHRVVVLEAAPKVCLPNLLLQNGQNADMCGRRLWKLELESKFPQTCCACSIVSWAIA